MHENFHQFFSLHCSSIANFILFAVTLFFSNMTVFATLLSQNILVSCNLHSQDLSFGWLTYQEGQNEEENKKGLRENKKIYQTLRKEWGKWKSCPPGTVRLAMALTLVILPKHHGATSRIAWSFFPPEMTTSFNPTVTRPFLLMFTWHDTMK